MKLAIVILNWNGQQLLSKFLPSILKYSNSKFCKIYVIDNASTDNSVLLLQNDFPEVKIIQNKTNGGFAKGYNDGLKQIDAPFYALVNSDIEVSKNWVDPVLEYFEEHPNTAIIQPKILDYNNKEYFEYAGAAGGFIDKYGYAFCKGRIFNTLEKDLNQYNENSQIFWASGACLFIRSEIFKELNGFDENYFAHFEEIDLCWRAQNKHHKISCISNSTVYHIGGATLNDSNPKKTFLNFRNSLLTLVKNAPKQKLIRIVFTRLILDGLAGVKFSLELKPLHTLAIIRAHFSFYFRLKSYLKLRQEINYKKKDYFFVKSIIWGYFLRGKKKYSDLTK